jgi:thiamine transport system ATP-binding protein
MTSRLIVRELTVSFGDIRILDRTSLDVAVGEVVALMGPSGVGKSTLLRAIAGLQPIDDGSIVIDSVDVTNTPTHRRGVGFVFQDLALFPHLTVAENIAYGLRRQRVAKHDRGSRVSELLELIGLPGIEARRPDTLSGGEQQRVALARALAPRPKLLLLDEPLAALDAERKDELIGELRRIITTTGTTAVHVTHDADEAERIADRVVMMRR